MDILNSEKLEFNIGIEALIFVSLSSRFIRHGIDLKYEKQYNYLKQNSSFLLFAFITRNKCIMINNRVRKGI